jgi:hypothetical protein
MHRMGKRFLYIMTGLAFLGIPETFSQESRLSYLLDQGGEYILDIDLTQNTHSESLNSDEISLYSRMRLHFHVDSVTLEGFVYLNIRYEDLLLSMLAPGLSIDINSGSGKNRLLSAMIDSLENSSFRAVMDLSGELRSLGGIDAIFASLQKFPEGESHELPVILSTLEEVYGPDAFRSLFGLLISVYPDVLPLTNWTRDMVYYFNTKPVNMVNRYYHTRTRDGMITIQGVGLLNSSQAFQEENSLGRVQSTVSGSQTYDFQMDRESGWLIKCLSRQRVMIETLILESSRLPEGLKIPSYTETVFDVKGKKL